jgi:pimeloyl-ACP methyl ester carboxylesterase
MARKQTIAAGAPTTAGTTTRGGMTDKAVKPGKAGESPRKRSATLPAEQLRVIYIHGIGKHPPPAQIKREWDLALFGREMGAQTRMAYWSDVLHPEVLTERTRRLRDRGPKSRGAMAGTLNTSALLAEAGVDPEDEGAMLLAQSLLRTMGVQQSVTTEAGKSSKRLRTKVLPLPAFLRKPIARAFLEALVKDSAAYFFVKKKRDAIRKRLIDVLKTVKHPVTIVAHSQGTVVTLEVLAELGDKLGLDIAHLITIGSPLGIQEVQDFLSCPLAVPHCVRGWHNFADPLDPVALDKGIANDFEREDLISDEVIMNTQVRNLEGFNPHSAAGYLSHPTVRRVVHDATRIDMHARFLVARDVAELLAVEERHPVLIEILVPQYAAIGESDAQMRKVEEAELATGESSLTARIDNAAMKIEEIVRTVATAEGDNPDRELDAARIERLRRFVAARLTPAEIGEITSLHTYLRIYRIWKSAAKRKLLTRSHKVIQADAAKVSYGAYGDGITWAVLDTGIRSDHPHFKTHKTIDAIWDCTQHGPPVRLTKERDKDGHGSHVAGIIAGSDDKGTLTGIAPRARLVIYKVLDDEGGGEDAWIIKALDHITEQNENSSELKIHGVNLSLGGPYDSTVYGCGFSPICAELRRLWRSGVLVVTASGNEGQVEVTTPHGEVELNSPMSIGDPANLEDCITVGSVHADRPHLYGISAFSSRGPTSDGRLKPDVVGPGERISSCNAHYRDTTKEELYCEESGTSMAAPHVSGLLAAFLSARREFRGRPDEVKEILLRTCTDIGRDRYHQGYGVPNLMKMLIET